ncbi:MAG: NUDIX domain-containing protein [Deltaproteobacteria bacterium]|nr:NUDIX domain-containing protein [Deltaproteobacteria bacterium]MBW2416913.1 NUDIX domain-containing protein [Deltaproteobacteria bacterium]
MTPDAPATPKPSATVVPLRDAPEGLEVLLLQRAKRDGSATGHWVFPGGKIEEQDRSTGPDPVLAAARAAAQRETWEEAGLRLASENFGLISRWITPAMSPKRFDTWFFAARVEADAAVRVDGEEIRTHAWFVPENALTAFAEGEIRLVPPTFVTLSWLADYADCASALAGLVRESVPKIEPRICPVEGGAYMLYPGDAGYEDGDLDRPGPRNRVHTQSGRLHYQRT